MSCDKAFKYLLWSLVTFVCIIFVTSIGDFHRAANAIVALGKKGIKHCETTTEVTCTSDLQAKVTADVDSVEESKEVAEGTLLKEEESACNSGNKDHIIEFCRVY